MKLVRVELWMQLPEEKDASHIEDWDWTAIAGEDIIQVNAEVCTIPRGYRLVPDGYRMVPDVN